MTSKLPRHVGIIPDGNRRWAKRHGKSLLETYLGGYRKVVEVVEYLYDKGVHLVSVYGLSRDNCIARNGDERKIIEGVAIYALRDIRNNEKLKRRGIRFRVLGDPQIFSEKVAKEASLTVKSLDKGEGGLLVVLICYKGSHEAQYYSSLGMVPPSLTLPPVDLIIRTGGTRRLSGFLPCLSEYAELYFTDTLWPDITLKEVDRALEWFSRQERNFGR